MFLLSSCATYVTWANFRIENMVTAPVRGRVMMFQPSCLQDLLKTHAFCNFAIHSCGNVNAMIWIPCKGYRPKPIISTFAAFLLHFSKIASAKLRRVTCCHTGHPSFCTSFACSHDALSMHRHRTWYLWCWHIHGLSATLESWEWPSWRDTRFGHILESLPSSRIASSEWEQWTETVYVSPGTIWSSAFVSWIAQRPCTVCDNTGNILSYCWETHWKPISLHSTKL